MNVARRSIACTFRVKRPGGSAAGTFGVKRPGRKRRGHIQPQLVWRKRRGHASNGLGGGVGAGSDEKAWRKRPGHIQRQMALGEGWGQARTKRPGGSAAGTFSVKWPWGRGGGRLGRKGLEEAPRAHSASNGLGGGVGAGSDEKAWGKRRGRTRNHGHIRCRMARRCQNTSSQSNGQSATNHGYIPAVDSPEAARSTPGHVCQRYCGTGL